MRTIILKSFAKLMFSMLMFQAGIVYSIPSEVMGAEYKKIKHEKFIAHAGGGVNGITYTNSLEALEESYKKGFKFYELDLALTSDNSIALIHGWGGFPKKLFNAENRVYSSSEFKKLKMLNGLTQLTLDELATWISRHKNAYIVTDFKTNNLDGLKIIAQKYPLLLKQFIPQIYRFEEYEKVVDLGYRNIIITLYTSNYSDADILNFSKKNDIFAITMPIDRANTDLPEKLDKMGKFVYTHTVNDIETVKKMRLKHVKGFYTDFLKPY